MQSTCDKQSFSSNPSLSSEASASKSIGTQIYERQRQRVENSLAANSAASNNPRPFSTLQRNPSRNNPTNIRTVQKEPKIASLQEAEDESIARAQSLRDLTHKFEQLHAKNGVESQNPTTVVRPIAKRFSLLEPSSSSLISNGEPHRAVPVIEDVTPPVSKESLVELYRKLEGLFD
jgi:hypothetical protein